MPESSVPGVFVKFDIEPILLTISESGEGVLGLCVRLVNVVSGVLVAGGWCFQLGGWFREFRSRRPRRQGTVDGILSPGSGGDEKKGSY